ncbi:MAG: IS66 family transposase [Crocinitomicaceae bacterium]|nr:IS66 family transposase [Crocinitomicaceae bacterium]
METPISKQLSYKELYESSQGEIAELKRQLSELKRMIFGSKSERFIPTEDGQLGLFVQQSEQQAETNQEQITYSREKNKNKQKPVRTSLPTHLPRVEEIIEPKDLVEGAKKIGEEITEILEYNPANVFVRRIIRPKYALPNDKGIVIGELPSLPLPKANAGASMLANLMVSKFVDHLPFYRQRQIFKRQKLELSDSTLGGWFNATCDLLSPLYDCLQNKVLGCNYLQMDESPIGVQDSHKKGSLHTGYQWVVHAPIERLVLFKYSSSRSGKTPKALLQNFYGTLQTDGYNVYQSLSDEITLVGCMAHARRYFEKALDNDPKRATYVLEQIQWLYDLERRLRERKVAQHLINRTRKRFAEPVLAELHLWMKQNIIEVLPKSAIGIAIAYSLKLWSNLARYTQDANYRIDNNLIENTIRPLALGRKNYLFAGSHNAAQRAAMMYSFFATCKVNGIEPLEWLTYTLNKIPEHKANKLEDLLPIN